MNGQGETLPRRLLASLTTAVLTALSVLVPLLDGGEVSRNPVLETEHDPATCVVGHDHTVCQRFSTQTGLRVEPAQVRASGPRHLSLIRLSENVPKAGGLDLSRIPRAPPST